MPKPDLHRLILYAIFAPERASKQTLGILIERASDTIEGTWEPDDEGQPSITHTATIKDLHGGHLPHPIRVNLIILNGPLTHSSIVILEAITTKRRLARAALAHIFAGLDSEGGYTPVKPT